MIDDNALDDDDRIDQADFDAIVAEAVTIVDQVQSLGPYLPQLAPEDRERVDDYFRRPRPARRCAPTNPIGDCFALGATKAVIAHSPRRPRPLPRS